MSSYNIQITIQWIPSHCGIEGNETADQLAKKGSLLPQPNVPVSYDTVRCMIKQNSKIDWLNEWALGKSGRTLFRHMPKPDLKDNISSLNRKEQSTIFRLRTGHFPLNYHLNRFRPDHSPVCQLCSCPYETVTHILFDCPKLTDLRSHLLPSSPSLDNTIYSTTDQLKNTCQFIFMTMGRRATTQEPLER